jgi:hypothetical protein
MAVGHAVFAVSSLLTILVVRQITARQELQQAKSPAPTVPKRAAPSAVVSGATATGGGWHPDPLGRFEYRYWDGSIWTDWVSRHGEMSIDPEPVPGY